MMQADQKPQKNKGESHFSKGEDKNFVTSLFNQSIDGIMVINDAGVVQLANSKAKELFRPLVDSLEGFEFGIPALSGAVEIQMHHTDEPRTIEIQMNEVEWQGATAYLAILRDITKRVRAQENLRESEQKYRQLFDNSINGFFLSEIVCDEQGEPTDVILLDVNKAFEEQIGLSEDDVINKPLSEIYPGFREMIILEVLESVSRTGQAERFEYYFKALDRYFDVACYPVSMNKVGTIFSDITERVEGEKALRKSEERFRTLYETMTQGVIYFDSEGRILSINPAGERILGIDVECCVGEKLDSLDIENVKLDLTPLPDYRMPHRIAARTGRSVIDCVLGLKCAQDDDCVWLNVSAVPQFHQNDEEPYQVISTFTEITDRIRVQKALQERVKELRCISVISSAIQNDPSLDELCQLTVQELCKGNGVP